jgi:hypothetical protein
MAAVSVLPVLIGDLLLGYRPPAPESISIGGDAAGYA